MELLHKLLLTTFVAALLSFIIAKVVSVFGGAVADDASNNKAETKASAKADVGSVFEEKSLKLEGFESERRSVEAVEAKVEKVNEFDPVPCEEIVEPVVAGSGLSEKSSDEIPGEVEETKVFDHEEVKEVDTGVCSVEAKIETIEFDAQSEEKDVEEKMEINDDEVKDVEFNAQSEEVKDVRFTAESDKIRDEDKSVNKDEVRDGEANAQSDETRDEVKNEKQDDETRVGEFNEKSDGIEDVKREEVKEELVFDDYDDDWEGIEITEMEKIFAEAAKFVASGEKTEHLSGVGSDVLMKLGALHKVVAEGPCLEPQPMALKVAARAKWNARQRLGNMSPDKAMEEYVALLSEKIPGWMEENSTEEMKAGLLAGATATTVDPSSSTSLHHLSHSSVERKIEVDSDVKGGDVVQATELEKKDMK